MAQWYETAYRRAVVDMHITADAPRFLAEFDADRYVDMLKLCQAQSVVAYAHSHVGFCYFPSRVGPVHPNLNGRDIFREIADRCHAADMAVVAYVSAIFDTQAYRNHADWRIRNASGEGVADKSRAGVCCPNAPYRDYMAGIARELCEGYDIDGLRYDMTFWPGVCYCAHCRARFAEEVGGELPEVVDWHDPTWVAFQRKREEWLVDFAGLLTRAVKDVNPSVSVEHQASTYAAPWTFGVTHHLAKKCDFLQGDFYGDALQGSLVRKLFLHLSENQPYGFETCVSVDLGNYTTLKSEELLTCKASAALADAGAFIFIDSIDPKGTLNPAAYERMGKVFGGMRPFESHIGGEPVHDVAVYLSTESKCDFADNGKRIDEGLSGALPHVDAALGACEALIHAHIPYGVITRNSLGDLDRHRVVVLPNVLMLGENEVEAFSNYVRGGGNLYASGQTSLTRVDGARQDTFLLADVLGVSCAGRTHERFTYIVPVADQPDIMPEYTRDHPAGIDGRQPMLEARVETTVLATLGLPYTDPDDPHHYASIHNNPPGVLTESPAIVQHSFGQGECIYTAPDVERYQPHRPIFTALIRRLCSEFSFEVEAPKAVEVTMFRQPERSRLLLALVNFQKELPNIPVHGVRVTVRTGGKEVAHVVSLPGGDQVPFIVEGAVVTFTVSRLNTLAMLAVEFAS